MKILITGGCGFLGSNLAKHALSRDDQVIILDDLSRKGSDINLSWLKQQGVFCFVQKDIRNRKDIESVVKEFCPEMIFHLAGQVAMTSSVSEPSVDFEINVIGTINILEAIRIYSPETAMVFSSTNKVYGDLEQFNYRETKTRFECIEKPDGFDETVSLNFRTPYGCSKGAADQYVLDYAKTFKLKTVVFRHSSLYGNRQFATYDQGWVGWFCRKAFESRNGKLKTPFTISGNGKQVRDILHIDDASRLYFAALNHIEIIKGEAFNIGGGVANSLSLLELFELLENLTGISLLYTKLSFRESDQKVFIADNKKAKRILGWEPKIDKISGIKSMLAWVENGK